MLDARLENCGRLAVFGGTFDPPHVGHAAIVDSVLSGGWADSVVLVPAARPPHKTSRPVADFPDRMEMTRLMAESISSQRGWSSARVSVSDVESRLGEGPTYTHNMMLALDREFDGVELLLLVGGDSLGMLHSWHAAREIAERWRVLTFPRAGGDAHSLEKVVRENWPSAVASRLLDSILPFEMVDVSSSMIRGCFQEDGDAASAYLLREVWDYIKRKGLYNWPK